MASETRAKDVEDARESVEKMSEFDTYENVLTVIAHDQSLVDVVGCFPIRYVNRDWSSLFACISTVIEHTDSETF